MLEKFFEFKNREPELYKLWENSGCFKPEMAKDGKAPVFNISMPPPNANGELHLGHAFGYTVMDILGRFRRLRGERVLLHPGKDHAGIQTQVVYEKKLKSEGVDLTSKSIQELYDSCYAFCIDRAKYMRNQEKTIGLSADWSKELFTLDPRLTDIIYDTFERMWNDGLVYRAPRIVNWSVYSQTSISDVEVDYKEQAGKLWYLLYPVNEPREGPELKLPGGESYRVGRTGLVTATTRPETMLGDSALAVHPDDDRYQAFVGKTVKLPLTGREIPIIADKRVDPSYGTGVIKVTPAHDFLDYEMGMDHGLEIIQVIGKDGRMTDAAGPGFKGMEASSCRTAVVEALSKEGLLLGEEAIKHKVPVSERGKDIVEPLVSDQWWVNVDKPGMSLKKKALSFIKEGRIKIYPQRFTVLFEQWLENLKDWNISRQLWWGHRIPVWYKKGSNQKEIYVGKAAPADPQEWEQEVDVFDTWFSSGQWAYSTVSAEGLLDLEKAESEFFPTHTMVMGRDILLFWACRMLLLTTYRLDTIPWKNIFFTGLIRDEHGQKMSKSKGNGVEPGEVIEKFGADAMRLAMVMGATAGNDVNFSVKKVEGYSKFINKIWNAAKLLELKTEEVKPTGSVSDLRLQSSRWIMRQLKSVTDNVASKVENFELSVASDEAYRFTWNMYCDWYLEVMKVLMDSGNEEWKKEAAFVSSYVYKNILILLHSFIPFVTEEVYQNLSVIEKSGLLATEKWPELATGPESFEEFELAMEIIGSVRSVKSVLQIPHKEIRVALNRSFDPEISLLIKSLAKVELASESDIKPELALKKPYSQGTIVCEVEGKDQYRTKLEKQKDENAKLISQLEAKLSGPFATHAKPDLVEQEKEKLDQARNALSALELELKVLK